MNALAILVWLVPHADRHADFHFARPALTFPLLMTQVPLESVALQSFTGIDKF